MSRVNVIVTTKKGAVPAESIRTELQNKGLTIENEMPQIGVITGSISPEMLSELRRIGNVESVEIDQTISVPPIDREEPM